MSCNQLQKFRKSEGGFSLMEVVIATAIMSFAFVGVMSLFAFNMRVEIMNRNRIIAAYLAQEATEIVRQKRDDNWFNSRDWRTDLGNGTHWVLSSQTPNNPTAGWELEQGADEEAVKYKQKIYLVNGEYVQTSTLNGDSMAGWKYTGFRRMIEISDAGALGDEIQIKVRIYYGDNVLLTVTSYLYNNWY